MKTWTEISLKVADGDAKSEATLSLGDAFIYSDPEQAKNDEYAIDDITTLELNSWTLDGTRSLVETPDTLDWGIWSNKISDENGDFSTNPILSAATINNYSAPGFTITFGGDTWPKQTATTWYAGSSILATKTDTVSGMTHFIDKNVDGFNKISIELIGTSVPHRRIKIAEVDFGQIFVWTSENILSAKVLEEVDLTSSELTINTLDLSIQDDRAEFNMLNPNGVYAYLQQKQRLKVVEYVNGTPRKMGHYYLRTWKNSSSVTAEFEAQDVIGLFDNITYKTSAMWSGAAFSAILESIMAAAGFTDYKIDSSLSGVTLSGYIPVVTVREALHEACFAARASVVSKRDGSISFIRLPSSENAGVFEKSRKFGDQTITQNDLVNSVAVTAYEWAAASGSTQLYSATLAAGIYEITFDAPAMGLSCSGGTITKSGVNYAVVAVTSAGTVTITGRKYESSTSVYTIEEPGLTNTKRAQATIDGNYLLSPDKAEAVAQFVYDDYQRRIVQKFKIAVDDEEVGDNVDVDTMLGARKAGVITSMKIDLTGGFLADLEVRG